MRRVRVERSQESKWQQWVQLPNQAEGHVRDIIEYTQSDVSSAKQIRLRFDEIRSALVHLIDRRARFVGTLVAAAPLLGLLGTVIGMLQTFLGISTSGGGETAGVVASGISEALFTTQMGLAVAIPGLLAGRALQRKEQLLRGEIEQVKAILLEGPLQREANA